MAAEINELYAAERDESRCARAALTEMERTHPWRWVNGVHMPEEVDL